MLKNNNSDKQSEGLDLHNHIQQTRQQIDQKETEQFQYKRELEIVRDNKNEQLKREIEIVQREIFNNQDIRKRQQQVIYQSKIDLRHKDKEVDDLGVKMQTLEKENRNLLDRQRSLNDHLDNKIVALEKTGGKLDQTLYSVNTQQQQISALDVQINEIERNIERHHEQQKKLLRQKDAEMLRGQDQQHGLKVDEQKLKEAEIQLEHLGKDLDGTRYSNDVLLDRNYDLKQELESLNSHSELLQSQNKELQRELDSFVETDEIVKRNLDRKDKVYNIRSKVDEVIKKSMMDLASKSPAKRARSPLQSQAQNNYQPAASQNYEMRNQQTMYRDSMNFRASQGSPLRRGHLDQY